MNWAGCSTHSEGSASREIEFADRHVNWVAQEERERFRPKGARHALNELFPPARFDLGAPERSEPKDT
jgi:hypothetical protein